MCMGHCLLQVIVAESEMSTVVYDKDICNTLNEGFSSAVPRS